MQAITINLFKVSNHRFLAMQLLHSKHLLLSLKQLQVGPKSPGTCGFHARQLARPLVALRPAQSSHLNRLGYYPREF